MSGNASIYDPRKTLDHSEFRILSPGEKPPNTANIAAFYNPNHEIHLVQKPRLKPGPGQVLVHVKATGICGWVWFACRPDDSSLRLFYVKWFKGAMCTSGNTEELEIP